MSILSHIRNLLHPSISVFFLYFQKKIKEPSNHFSPITPVKERDLNTDFDKHRVSTTEEVYKESDKE